MSPSPRSSRSRKIKPLSIEEALAAPSMKGLVSFLDVTPEDFRAGRYDLQVEQRTRPKAALPSAEGVTGTPESKNDVLGPVMVQDTAEQSYKSGTSVMVRQLKGVLEAGSDFSHRGLTVVPAPLVSTPGDDSSPVHVTSTGDDKVPGIETIYIEHSSRGRGKSKVRRCVLAQDGHSLGEQAIYWAMWQRGRSEGSGEHVSRTVCIGLADLSRDVRMAKKNVKQNVARLFEKKSIEVLSNYNAGNSTARTYRIYSYKQILERRKASGLEYVLRNKGVVFCDSEGTELSLTERPIIVPTPGNHIGAGSLSSPGDDKTPGIETIVQPISRRQRNLKSHTVRASVRTEIVSGEAAEASRALNAVCPVDLAAVEQLIRDCRQVRADAHLNEIIFYATEKLDAAIRSRKITNPVGLMLASVPQAFVGDAVLLLRNRLEEDRQRREAEAIWRDKQDQSTKAWIESEIRKRKAVVADTSLSQATRDKAADELADLQP